MKELDLLFMNNLEIKNKIDTFEGMPNSSGILYVIIPSCLIVYAAAFHHIYLDWVFSSKRFEIIRRLPSRISDLEVYFEEMPIDRAKQEEDYLKACSLFT